MMNQSAESPAGYGPNLMQKYPGVEMSQGHTSLMAGNHSWSSSTGPVAVSWNSYGTSNAPVENGALSNSSYHYDTQRETAVTGDAHNGSGSVSHASTSSSIGAANVNQEYASYAPYSTSTEGYAYNNTGYQNYYNYQQSASSSSSQQVGSCQNSGAPYQSFSSFQHAGSYVAPTSYSSTYYNAGDHQTAAGYPNSSYVNQSNYWNEGSSGSYPPQQYANYTQSVANSTHVASNTATSSLNYQQYSQWPYYYYPPAQAASSVPVTEPVLTTAPPAYPIPAAPGGYSYPSNQPPPPGTTSWRREPGFSVSSFSQDTNNVTAYNPMGSSEVPSPASQSHQMNQIPSHLQKAADSSRLPSENCQDQQMTMHSQGSVSQASSTNQVLENFQSPMQTTMLDTRRVSKMQIPTNPRIASSLAFGMSKADQESSMDNASAKPAFVCVQVPKPSYKLPSHDDAEAIMKAAFPASLRTYVERTFARCKDDAQRDANQKLMKEIITKATADGTLFTRNWDVEPLFPLSNSVSDETNQNVHISATALPKYKRSPSRRTKSRWEPIADEKFVEKITSTNYELAKSAEKMVESRKNEGIDNSWNRIKFLPAQEQTPSSKTSYRPGKKPRFTSTAVTSVSGDASSDSDKEQGLTKYYASAITLADSPEEKRRREHRYKRFEKAQENKAEPRHYRPKVSGTGDTYTRRASAMLIVKNSEVSCSRAVEDIDWDALTVKGTCSEVEKRYLRLTSAPDPATVRPEEILEKALHMVHISQKNYLYKCDQLKSIRQDLTVQRIHNELTVKVYETHARLALEAGDLPEYNQCQSQLNRLYADGFKGCYMEFSAYHLLCVILHSNNKKDLLSAMARLSDQAKEDGAVKHALAVRSAISSGNYVQFFRLYKDAPNLNSSLMDLNVEKIRFSAIKCICKSYRPTLPISYIARTLGFSREVQTRDVEDRDASGLDECEEWLKAHGAVLTIDNDGVHQLDTKASAPTLYMPEPEDAVAHGDATLAVNDFLTRSVS